MPTLYFSEKHKELVELLCSKSDESGLEPIFKTYRDLMLFAAMVGKSLGKTAERVGIGGEVESSYFRSPTFNKEGVVYLLGLLEYEDPNKLKDGAGECWKLFEAYCAAGMDEIAGWISESGDHSERVRALHEKMLEIAKKKKKIDVKVKRSTIRLSANNE